MLHGALSIKGEMKHRLVHGCARPHTEAQRVTRVDGHGAEGRRAKRRRGGAHETGDRHAAAWSDAEVEDQRMNLAGMRVERGSRDTVDPEKSLKEGRKERKGDRKERTDG